MLIVTGTKRSGTSMWMQILSAAGFEYLGQRFPGVWEKSLKEANPLGFYESKLRRGIYYATNPDPETGHFLHPRDVTRHVVKVFVPGLIRTDYAYIGAVIATMREWREYSASLKELHALEDAYRADAAARGEQMQEAPFADEATDAFIRSGRIPPALEWWFENYDLIRDMAVRGYHFHMTTYDRLLRDPQQEVGKVLTWLGQGELTPAVDAVRPEMKRQKGIQEVDDLVADHEGIFDELYAAVDGGVSLDAAFVSKLNETNAALSERWKEVVRARSEVENTAPRSER